jgi:hypothetical protein
LPEPQFLLHPHRRERRRGRAGKDNPESIALQLDDAPFARRSQTGNELTVLAQ